MQRTRLLYLISSLAQGGAERHLLELVRALDDQRFTFDICVLRDEVHYREDLPPGQPRYHLHSQRWFSPLAFTRLLRAIAAARPAILHTYLNDGNLWGRLAAMVGARTRVVTSVHLDEMELPYRLLERVLARRSDRIVAHSLSIARLLVDRVGVESSRVVVIANGVDPERYRPAGPALAAAARERYRLGEGDLVALMPARIAPQKNHDLVVRALTLLRRQGALPENFRLLLAGRVSSSSYHQRVEGLIAEGGLENTVRFLGPVHDMPALYAATDVVLMPSRTEASPIAALEALACGIPVVISAAANTDAVVVEGQQGWSLARPSAATIADTMRAVFAQTVGERRAMAERCRAHVLRSFTMARVAADLTRLYDSLAAR